MLDLAGIPLRASERHDGPLVIAGGPCTSNPEPMAPFMDAFVIGDGEEVVLRIADVWMETEGQPRERRLEALAQVEGVYVPSLYVPDGGGGLAATRGAPERVRRAWLRDLESAAFPASCIVPTVEAVHERVTLEIARGCTRGCRFCHAGMTTRPVRNRGKDVLLEQARALLRQSGHEEVSLLSLSAADHPEVTSICDALLAEHRSSGVSLSLPSTRADAFSVALAERVAEVRKSGVTLAPEAGSQRLRDVINKQVSEEQILEAARAAYAAGFGLVKLYFMLGLPTETDDDALAIAGLIRRIADMARELGSKRGKAVNASLAAFVPKPHTPFPWEAQADEGTLERRRSLITDALRRERRADVRWHDPASAAVECALARGGREIAGAVEWAFRLGCRLDGWREHFRPDLWAQAFEAAGLTVEHYQAALPPEEPLPWDHMDAGVSRAFLLDERRKALLGQLTEDCEGVRCHVCGAGCAIAH
jgi:radical SAM family uncharacterized protein